MRSRLRTWTALLAVGAILLTACGTDGDDVDDVDDASADTDEEPDVEAIDEETLAVATAHPEGNWQATPWQDFGDAVEEASENRLTFDYNWAGSLLADAETVAGLESGIADLAYPVFAYTAADFPIDTWMSELGFLADRTPVVGALQAYAATLEWGFENPEFLEEMESNGLAPLLPRFQLIPEYHLICTEEVTGMDDFDGLRTRTGGPAWANAAEALGMSTVTVPTLEIFETLQRGVVDCSMNGFADFIGLGLWDAADQVTETGFAGWTSYSLSMGLPRWEGLSVDAQQVIWDNLDVYIERMLNNSLEEHHRFVVEGTERGLTFNELEDEARTAIDDYHAEVLETAADDAPEGVDGQAMVDSIVELHEKWAGIAVELGLAPNEDNYSDWAMAQPEDGPDVDISEFVERMREEILEPNRPQ